MTVSKVGFVVVVGERDREREIQVARKNQGNRARFANCVYFQHSSL